MTRPIIPVTSSIPEKKVRNNPKGRPKISPTGKTAKNTFMRLSPEAINVLDKLPAGSKTQFVNRAIIWLWNHESGKSG